MSFVCLSPSSSWTHLNLPIQSLRCVVVVVVVFFFFFCIKHLKCLMDDTERGWHSWKSVPRVAYTMAITSVTPTTLTPNCLLNKWEVRTCLRCWLWVDCKIEGILIQYTVHIHNVQKVCVNVYGHQRFYDILWQGYIYIYKDEAPEAFMLNSPGASSSSFSGSFAVNEFSRHFRI